MFFPDKIQSIKETDNVLEIGPGATPYFRSDVFLEKQYTTEQELIAQSGHVGKLKTDKRVVTYTGDVFPFEDKEFDYVVCSHVLEHVDNANLFLKEVQRVGKKGYLEFPTIYYDYIYNFPEHQLFLFKKDGVINWMTKAESGLSVFLPVQQFFYRTCEQGYHEMIDNFRQFFFQGFEWFDAIESKRVATLDLVTYSLKDIEIKSKREFLQDLPSKELYSNISLKKLLKYKLANLLKIEL